jgi:hypothetical protein
MAHVKMGDLALAWPAGLHYTETKVCLMSESLLLNGDGEAAARAATEGLTRRGLQVVRSFDLRAAREAHSDCACPYHGTAECTCQYVVLLVYDASGALAVLTLHGRDAQSRAQIVRDASNRPDVSLVELIFSALLEAALQLQTVRAQGARVGAGTG